MYRRYYSEIINYLVNGTYWQGATDLDQAVIHKRASKYRILNGVLYHKGKGRGVDDLRYVPITAADQLNAIRICHVNEENDGHYGINKTASLLSSKFYWRMMYTDVVKFVKKCPVCKELNNVQWNFLQEEEKEKANTWKLIEIDILENFHSTRKNVYHVVRMVDVFSNWTSYVPLTDLNEKSIVKGVLKEFSIVGFPLSFRFLNAKSPSLILKALQNELVSFSVVHSPNDSSIDYSVHVTMEENYENGQSKPTPDQYLIQYQEVIDKHKASLYVFFGSFGITVEEIQTFYVKKLEEFCKEYPYTWSNKLHYLLFSVQNTTPPNMKSSPHSLVFGRSGGLFHPESGEEKYYDTELMSDSFFNLECVPTRKKTKPRQSPDSSIEEEQSLDEFQTTTNASQSSALKQTKAKKRKILNQDEVTEDLYPKLTEDEDKILEDLFPEDVRCVPKPSHKSKNKDRHSQLKSSLSKKHYSNDHHKNRKRSVSFMSEESPLPEPTYHIVPPVVNSYYNTPLAHQNTPLKTTYPSQFPSTVTGYATPEPAKEEASPGRYSFRQNLKAKGPSSFVHRFIAISTSKRGTNRIELESPEIPTPVKRKAKPKPPLVWPSTSSSFGSPNNTIGPPGSASSLLKQALSHLQSKSQPSGITALPSLNDEVNLNQTNVAWTNAGDGDSSNIISLPNKASSILNSELIVSNTDKTALDNVLKGDLFSNTGSTSISDNSSQSKETSIVTEEPMDTMSDHEERDSETENCLNINLENEDHNDEQMKFNILADDLQLSDEDSLIEKVSMDIDMNSEQHNDDKISESGQLNFSQLRSERKDLSSQDHLTNHGGTVPQIYSFDKTEQPTQSVLSEVVVGAHSLEPEQPHSEEIVSCQNFVLEKSHDVTNDTEVNQDTEVSHKIELTHETRVVQEIGVSQDMSYESGACKENLHHETTDTSHKTLTLVVSSPDAMGKQLGISKEVVTSQADMLQEATASQVDLSQETPESQADLSQETSESQADLSQETSESQADLSQETSESQADLSQETSESQADLSQETSESQAISQEAADIPINFAVTQPDKSLETALLQADTPQDTTITEVDIPHDSTVTHSEILDDSMITQTEITDDSTIKQTVIFHDTETQAQNAYDTTVTKDTSHYTILTQEKMCYDTTVTQEDKSHDTTVTHAEMPCDTMVIQTEMQCDTMVTQTETLCNTITQAKMPYDPTVSQEDMSYDTTVTQEGMSYDTTEIQDTTETQAGMCHEIVTEEELHNQEEEIMIVNEPEVELQIPVTEEDTEGIQEYIVVHDEMGENLVEETIHEPTSEVQRYISTEDTMVIDQGMNIFVEDAMCVVGDFQNIEEEEEDVIILENKPGYQGYVDKGPNDSLNDEAPSSDSVNKETPDTVKPVPTTQMSSVKIKAEVIEVSTSNGEMVMDQSSPVITSKDDKGTVQNLSKSFVIGDGLEQFEIIPPEEFSNNVDNDSSSIIKEKFCQGVSILRPKSERTSKDYVREFNLKTCGIKLQSLPLDVVRQGMAQSVYLRTIVYNNRKSYYFGSNKLFDMKYEPRIREAKVVISPTSTVKIQAIQKQIVPIALNDQKELIPEKAHTNPSVENKKQQKKKIIPVVEEIKNFKCPVCPKTVLPNEDMLNLHLKFHCASEVRNIICPICSKPGNSWQALLRHYSNHDEGRAELKRLKVEVPNNALCPICRKICSSKETLSQHMQFKHPANESGDSYKCDKCDETFKDSKSLKRHSEKHINQSYSCEDCGYSTKVHYNYLMHKDHECPLRKGGIENIKTEPIEIDYTALQISEPRLKCEKCKFTSSTMENLEEHVKSKHPANKHAKYKCDFCTMKFRTVGALNSHIPSHEDLMNYTCKLCDYKSKYKSAVSRHAKSKHPELPVKQLVQEPMNVWQTTKRKLCEDERVDGFKEEKESDSDDNKSNNGTEEEIDDGIPTATLVVSQDEYGGIVVCDEENDSELAIDTTVAEPPSATLVLESGGLKLDGGLEIDGNMALQLCGDTAVVDGTETKVLYVSMGAESFEVLDNSAFTIIDNDSVR